MGEIDRRDPTDAGVGARTSSGTYKGVHRWVVAGMVATIAATAVWPAAAPASHPPYPDATTGTVQEGMTLLTSKPFCSAPWGANGEHKSQLATHGGDMAFWKSRAVLACGGDDDNIENDGFVILDIADPAHPVKLGELRCVASASDIALWGDLVFLAVDRNSEAGNTTQPGPKGDESCSADVDDPRTVATFAGVRIVSIADPAAPALVKSVRTSLGPGPPEASVDPTDPAQPPLKSELWPRGAHNVTVVPDLSHRDEHGAEQPRVLVYAAFPRSNHQDVVAVPLDAPEDATIDGSIKTPGLETDTGSHYPDTNGCHDISFFLPLGLATCHALSSLGNSMSGTIIWDVRDDPGDSRDDGASPLEPKVVSQITSAGAGFPERRDHSSAFSWDGRTLVISDENLHGLATNSCDDGSVLWFYDITKPYKPELRGKHVFRDVKGNGWCPSKQISVVPLLDGRDVLIASWLGGGTTVVDFTDPSAPEQIGVFANHQLGDAKSPDADRSLAWASYWYAGHVFVNNAWGCARKDVCFGSKLRGLDVLALDGITASQTARLQRFNFGTQECLPRMHSVGPCK